MGTLSIVTNTYTVGSGYATPTFTAYVQAEVTTILSVGAGNVVVTVTYTNEVGTAGRTGTITIPRGSVVASRWNMVFQAGDLGVQSIQNLSVAPTLAAGVIKVLGLFQLTFHEDQSATNQVQTHFPTGQISYGPGTVLGVEYAGGTVSKQRILDVLLQLVPV
jgi:hypothetical protein